MPWSFMRYIPEVFRLVRQRGYEYEGPVSVLRTELKRATGVVNDKTVAGWLRTMEEMGYIRTKSHLVVELCVDVDQPYVFLSSKLVERDEGVEVSEEVSKSEAGSC